MIRDTLSLNRIANVFHVILVQLKEYDSLQRKIKKEEKIARLQKLIRTIDICIDVIDKKVKLKGTTKDFVAEARLIKTKQIQEQKDWRDYLNIFNWFKNDSGT